MIKSFFFLLLLLSFSANAQILDEYPKNQSFYNGGLAALYKEANQILTDKKQKNCGPDEIYQPRILVTKDSVVKLFTDQDSVNINKNKCAYDVSMLLLKNLHHWKPAEVNGQKFGAITEFIVYPADLMSNYQEDYDVDNFRSDANYPGGSSAFKKDFDQNFKSLFVDYQINGIFNLEFYVSKEGKIENVRIFPLLDNKNFNSDFVRALARIKKKWKPSQYKNIPIKQRISFPIDFRVNFRER